MAWWNFWKGSQPPEPKIEPSILKAIAPIFDMPMGDRPVTTQWTVERSLREGYKVSHLVYLCIRKLMTTASSVGFYVKERQKDGEYVRLPDHPAAKLLAYPNPEMSGQDLLEDTTGHLNLCGNALWKIVMTSDGPSEIYGLNPDCIKPVPGKDRMVQYYVGTDTKGYTKKDKAYKPEEIIHFQFRDPANPLWGMCPLQAAATLIDCEVDALTWWKNSMRNRCIKDGAFTFKHDLTQDQYDLILSELRRQILGSQNARGPLVLGHEASYQPFSLNPVEMDFTKSRTMLRTEICLVFGVPPILLFPDASSYNNMITARAIFWLDTVIPYLDGLVATMNQRLLPYYLKRGQSIGDLQFGYDLGKVEALIEAFSRRVKVAMDLFGMGVPLNTVIQTLNLPIPPVEGGDRGYISHNVFPLGEAGPVVEESVPKNQRESQTGSEPLKGAAASQAAEDAPPSDETKSWGLLR